MATSDDTVNPYSSWSTKELIGELKDLKWDLAWCQSSMIEYYKKESTCIKYGNSYCEWQIKACNSSISKWNADIIKMQQVLSARAVDVENIMHETVDRMETLSLILGGGGVGKTSLAALLLELEPILLRVSTPCAVMQPWLMKNIQVQKYMSGVKLLSKEEHSELMMNVGCIVESHSGTEDALPAAILPDRKTSMKHMDSVDLNVTDIYLLEARRRVRNAKLTGKHVFGRIVDVGGQPQLLELLPRFLLGITLGAAVIDLSQGLDKYPTSYFYGKNGKPIGKGIRSNLTNEQILRVFMQMIASLSISTEIRIIIVGTHRDVEWRSFEARSTKERKLKDIIISFGLEKNIIYTDETHTNVVFAVNAKTPDNSDRHTAKKIMEIMMSEEAAKHVSIPVKHHKLELTLQRLSGDKRIAVTFDELYSSMSSYYDSTEAMIEALHFLNQSLRIFYFREFPQVIFGIPQRLLNLMTEITVYHIQLTTNPDEAATSDGMWKQFKEQGILNENILKKISDSYDKVLTPSLMLEVMEKLLITCKLQEGEFLMPSLLTALASLPPSQSFMLRWLPFGLGNYLQKLISGMESNITMLAHFSVGLSQLGIFCGTVCKLISDCKWTLIREVSRNRFYFKLPYSPGVISLIDSFDSFFIVNLEVQLHLPSESVSMICSEIRETLFSVIKKVTAELKYTTSNPALAFLCEHSNSSPHVAEYLQKFDCLRCIKDHHTSRLTDKHRLWLHKYNNDSFSSEEANPQLPTTSKNKDHVEDIKSDISKASYQNQHNGSMNLHQVHKKISENNHAKLQKEIQSEHHIFRLAKVMIDWEDKFYLFRLHRHEVYDIKNGQNKDRPILQRTDVLHAWKDKFLYPTYECLLEILVEGGFTDCVTEMVTIINEDCTVYS